ncbi:hypothetical protein ACXR2U_05360 [Jatrophihabitans sp. YIM 134969]
MDDTHQGVPSGDPELDRRLAAVDARARRRWLVTMGAVVVVVAVVVPVLQPLLDGRRPHRSVHHGGAPTWVAVAVPVGIIVVGIAVVAWLLTRRRGVFAPPLVGGLPRTTRRGIGRTLRRGGPPSPDPLVREVEVRTARRAVRQSTFGYLVFGVLLVLSLALAVFDARTTAGVVFHLATAVLFAGFLVLQVVTTRGAKRYLAGLDPGAP